MGEIFEQSSSTCWVSSKKERWPEIVASFNFIARRVSRSSFNTSSKLIMNRLLKNSVKILSNEENPSKVCNEKLWRKISWNQFLMQTRYFPSKQSKRALSTNKLLKQLFDEKSREINLTKNCKSCNLTLYSSISRKMIKCSTIIFSFIRTIFSRKKNHHQSVNDPFYN